MPKIEAATVAAHHQMMDARVVDAAESILREGIPLTAGAVSQRAGIARTSLYRYVETVEDLRSRVLARHLPQWRDAVRAAMEDDPTPAGRIRGWVRASVELGGAGGHAWIVRSAREAPTGGAEGVGQWAHRELAAPMADAWAEIVGDDPTDVRLSAAFTWGIVESAFRAETQGVPHPRAVEAAGRAADALVASWGPRATLG